MTKKTFCKLELLRWFNYGDKFTSFVVLKATLQKPVKSQKEKVQFHKYYFVRSDQTYKRGPKTVQL